MSDRQPLADIAAEASDVLAGCAAHQVSARLIGGLAVSRHQHLATPPELRRSYGDIDIVIGRKEGRGVKAALTSLGYEPNERFNALRGDRRMLFYDTVNGRQIDVFVGTFAMCHTLDLSGRLGLLPDTLSLADLVLTKLQIVQINTKDLVDAAQLLRNHQLSRADEAGRDEVSLDRLCAVTSGDWGWYTTLSDNLARVSGFALDALAEADAAVVVERVSAIQRAIDEPGKSLRWKARARIGRHAPWYELPEEVAHG